MQVTSKLEGGEFWFAPLPCSLMRTCSSISRQRQAAAKYFELASVIHGHVREMANAARQGVTAALCGAAPLPCSWHAPVPSCS